MSNTNYIIAIVRVLEAPKQKFLRNNIVCTKFRVQLPQIRGSRIVNLIFWGNLADDVLQFYMTNDYIIIEGYISLKMEKSLKLNNLILNKLEITVLRIYPFLLNYNRSNTEI